MGAATLLAIAAVVALASLGLLAALFIWRLWIVLGVGLSIVTVGVVVAAGAGWWGRWLWREPKPGTITAAP